MIRSFTGVDHRNVFNIDESKSFINKNITLDDYPVIRNREGSKQLGAMIIGSAKGLGAWKNSELHAVFSDEWFKWNGSTWTSLTTGLNSSTTNYFASFCNFQGNLSGIHLIMANGSDPVKKYDGTSVSNLNNAPAGIQYIDAHDNRLYGAAGNTIYFSALRKPEDWTTLNDAGSIVIESNDGETINSIKSGLQKLTVFKPNSMYELYGTGASNYRLVQIADNIGILNHRCSAFVNGILYFLHPTGIYRYSGGTRPDNTFSAPIQSILDATFKSYPDSNTAIRSCVGAEGDSIYVSIYGRNNLLSDNTNTSNNPWNVILQYHTVYDTWTVYSMLQRYPLFFYNMNNTLYGQAAYNVITFKSGDGLDRFDDGGSISKPAIYVTKAFDLGSLSAKSRFTRVFVSHSIDSGVTLTVYARRTYQTGSTISSNDWISIGTITGSGEGVKKNRFVMLNSSIDQTGNDDFSTILQLKFQSSGNGRFAIYEYGFELLPEPIV